jgi:hypothetical protein
MLTGGQLGANWMLTALVDQPVERLAILPPKRGWLTTTVSDQGMSRRHV